jgi:eukaryotic-like serine/threonine-protein kinase
MHLLQPGQIFAERYRVERLLAEGGMGAVFVAEQLATEMRVALKVLWPHILASTSAVEKFQIEAKVAARVNSEHIVRVFDAGFDPETKFPFLVMELLSGKPLEDVVLERGRCTLQDTVLYISQTASGLDKSHGYVDRDGVARPIVHRDLKPENLFLTHRESGDPVVKILDFGIAKVVSENTAVSREMKGTPLYMAYEQGTGDKITPRTDVWALGLITFFLLTGKSYWRSASNADAGLNALLSEILSLPIAPPTQRIQELGMQPPWPAAFDQWFLRCVDRAAGQRFSSAGEAARSLAEALLGPQGLAVGPTAVSPGPWVADAGTSSPGVAVAQTSGASLPGIGATQENMVLSRSHGAGRSSAGSPALPLAIAAGAFLLVGGVAAAAYFTLRGGSAPAVVSAEPVAIQPPAPALTASAAPAPVVEPAPSTAATPSATAAPAALRPAPTAAAPVTAPVAAPKPTRKPDDLYGER